MSIRMRSGWLIIPNNLPKSAIKREFDEFYKVKPSEENPKEFAELDESPDLTAKSAQAQPQLLRDRSTTGVVGDADFKVVTAGGAATQSGENTHAPAQPSSTRVSPAAGQQSALQVASKKTLVNEHSWFTSPAPSAYGRMGNSDFFPGAILSIITHRCCFVFVEICRNLCIE
jgi:hypothetical protein